MNRHTGLDFLRKVSSVRHELPYSPDLLKTLFAQTSDASIASAQEIAETVSKDQGLSGCILSLANSAFYGLQSQVCTVQRATAVLGVREVRTLVLALGVKSLTTRFPIPKNFDLTAYWTHQLMVGSVARGLTKDTQQDPDLLFTAGLLHDMGKLIIAMHAPQEWEQLRQIQQEENLPAYEAEERLLGVDHGVVGALVLKSWSLPSILVEAVNWHHSPDMSGLPPRIHFATALLGLADSAVHTASAGEGQDQTQDSAPDEDCTARMRDHAQTVGVDSETACTLAQDALTDEGLADFASIIAA